MVGFLGGLVCVVVGGVCMAILFAWAQEDAQEEAQAGGQG
jgi:hypothetical protein